MAVRKKLGDLLIEAKAIDEHQLEAALAHQRKWGGRIGRILVDMRVVQDQQICDTVARQLGIASVQLDGCTVDSKLLELIPLKLCERHWLFPLALVGGERGSEKLQLAMSDPTNLAVVDELRFKTGRRVEVAVAPDSQIEAAIRRHFYGEAEADQRPRQALPLEGVQFAGQDVDFSEPSLAEPDDLIPADAMRNPVPSLSASIPAATDPLLELFGLPPDDANDQLDALLGIGGPAVAAAASMPGDETIHSARQALFAAPGGLSEDVDDEAAEYPAMSGAASLSFVAQGPPMVAGTTMPPDWPPRLTPVSGTPIDDTGSSPVAEEEPVWGEADLLEEFDACAEEAPLVVGTLIEFREPASDEGARELGDGLTKPIGWDSAASGGEPEPLDLGAGVAKPIGWDSAVSDGEPEPLDLGAGLAKPIGWESAASGGEPEPLDLGAGLPKPIGWDSAASGGEPEPLELGAGLPKPIGGESTASGGDPEPLEFDTGLHEPIDRNGPRDPLADEAALVAALVSMAAGNEEPLPARRLIAALALALIRKGSLRGADLLEELRR